MGGAAAGGGVQRLVEVRVDVPNPGLRIRPGIKGMIDLPLRAAAASLSATIIRTGIRSSAPP